MERNEVYRLIDGERAYQQAQGLPDQRQTQEWLDSMEYYMGAAWQLGEEAGELDRLAEIRKIAALAVAALEQHGCPPREGYEAGQQRASLQPESKEETPAYIARCRGCNAVIGATVDANELKRNGDIADFLAETVRAGYIVERTTVEAARELFGSCTCTEGPMPAEKPDYYYIDGDLINPYQDHPFAIGPLHTEEAVAAALMNINPVHHKMVWRYDGKTNKVVSKTPVGEWKALAEQEPTP